MKIIISENKFSKIAIELLNTYGYVGAAKLTSKSLCEFLLSINTPINIDSDMAHSFIISAFIDGKLQNQMGDFKLHYDNFEGVLYWFYENDNLNGPESGLKLPYPKYNERMVSMCTPFWDAMFIIPVESSFYRNRNFKSEEDYLDSIELTSKLIGKESYTYFNSGNEIITWFNDFYIPNVYDILLNTHLPKYRLLYKESGLNESINYNEHKSNN